MNRRTALAATSALAASGLLAACGVIRTSNTGGVTTLTVNLTSLQAYAEAAQNATSILLVSPIIAAALGSVKVALIEGAVAAIVSQVEALTAKNPTMTLTFTASSAPAALAAIEADANTILSAGGVMFGSLKSSLAAPVEQTVLAFQTVVDLMRAVVASQSVAAVKTPMTGNAALALLGVK